MSAEFTVKSSDMLEALGSLNSLFPAGQKSMPLGISIDRGLMCITCLSGCVYQATIAINKQDINYEATILYHDITPLLHLSGTIHLEFSEGGLQLTSNDISCSFVYGYSVVTKQEFKNIMFREIAPSSYQTGLKDIVNMNLDKLYSMSQAVMLLGDVALQKFPNTWVQVRTTGLGLRMLLDLEHIKLLLRFSPTGVHAPGNNTVLFRNKRAILQLPCKPLTDDEPITSLMGDLGKPVNLELHSYTEKVRIASRLDSKSLCSIALHEAGLKTTIVHERSSISVTTGDILSPVLKVFKLPIQVWLTFLKVIDSNSIQVLIGGDKVCLRTPFLIIMTRVLH